MARPKKEGLEYFSIDVNMGIDDEVELIEAEYGLKGFAIFIKLLQMIYKKGYYAKWCDKEKLLFKKKVVEKELVDEIVCACLRWGLFNKDIFDTHKVLTSHGIQQRFLLAMIRRKEVEMEKDYLLLSKKEIAASKVPIIIISSNDEKIGGEDESADEKINPTTDSSCELTSEEKEVFEKVIQSMEQEYSLLPQSVSEDIKMCVKEGMEIDVFMQLMKSNKAKEKHSSHYTVSIFKNKLKEGIKTLNDIERSVNTNEKYKGSSGTTRIERSSAELQQLQYKSKPGDDKEVPF